MLKMPAMPGMHPMGIPMPMTGPFGAPGAPPGVPGPFGNSKSWRIEVFPTTPLFKLQIGDTMTSKIFVSKQVKAKREFPQYVCSLKANQNLSSFI
jgi:hypothetical protein